MLYGFGTRVAWAVVSAVAEPLMARHRKNIIGLGTGLTVAVASLGALGVATSADAQSMNTNSASFNAGYGRIAGQENRVVDYSTRDANGNRIIVDGVMLTGADQSVYSSSHSSGSLDSYSGVGALGGYGSSTAIDRKSTRLNSSHSDRSRMPSSA